MGDFSMPVRSHMSAPAHTIAMSAELQKAERRLGALSISSLAMVHGPEHRLVGVISRTDLLAVGRLHAAEGDRRAPAGFPGVGCGEGDIEALAAGAEAQARLLRNAPRAVDRDALRALFRGALHYR